MKVKDAITIVAAFNVVETIIMQLDCVEDYTVDVQYLRFLLNQFSHCAVSTAVKMSDTVYEAESLQKHLQLDSSRPTYRRSRAQSF